MKTPARQLTRVLAIVICAALLPFGALATAGATPAPAIYGVVTDADGGAPLEGVAVAVSYDDLSDPYYDVVYTDSSGAYALTPPPGTYDLSASADGYASETLTGVVFDGASSVQRDFELEAYPRAFYGTVTDSVTSNPIEDATVRAISQSGEYVDVSAQTNAAGGYELYAPAGDYEFIVTSPGYAPDEQVDVVFNGTNVRQINVALVPYPVAIVGRVTDESTGDPIEGALVSAEFEDDDNSFRDSDFTDADGDYELYLPGGPYAYEVRVSVDGYRGENDPAVTYSGGSPTVRDFVLEELTGDTTPPTTTIAGVPSDWTSQDVTFTLSATDGDGSGVKDTWWRMGADATPELYTDPVCIKESGLHEIQFYSEDNEGNVEDPAKTKQVKIDKAPPVTTSNVVSTYVNSATVKLTPSDEDGAGVKETKWRLGTSGAWNTGTSVPPVTTTGKKTLQYYSVDKVDNAENMITKTFSVVAVTSMSIKAVSPTKYGGAATISGYLRKGSSTGPGIGGQIVRVQRYTSGTWMTVKSITTPSSGYVSFSQVPPSSTSSYRVLYMGKTDEYQAATSATAKVTPKAYVGKTSAKRVSTRKYKLSGVLKPWHTKGTKPIRIYKWRKVGSKWKSYGYVKATASNYSSYTKYSVTYKFPVKGKWRLQAVHPADSGHATSKSSYSYYTIK